MEIVDVREKDYVLINDIKVVKRKMYQSDLDGIYNGIYLSTLRSVGNYQRPIRKNIRFGNNSIVIYICGNQIVCHDTSNNIQAHVPLNKQEGYPTSINCVQINSKETYLSISLSHNQAGVSSIIVCDLYKNAFYKLNLQSQKALILDTAFISEGKYLVALASLPSQKTMVVKVFRSFKEKLLCYSQIEFNKCCKIEIGDSSSSEFIIYGRKFCKLYVFESDNYNIVEKLDIYQTLCQELVGQIVDDICDCLWLKENKTLIIGTYTNTLIVLKDFKFKSKVSIDTSHLEKDSQVIKLNDQNEEQHKLKSMQSIDLNKFGLKTISISCMAFNNKTIAIGFQNTPFVSFYQLNSSFNLISKGNFQIKEEGVQRINSIEISPDGLLAVISVLFFPKHSPFIPKIESSGVIAMNEEEKKEQQGRIELFTFNVGMVDINSAFYTFEPLSDLNTSKGSIVDLALCHTRSVAATVCEDRSAKFIEFGPGGYFRGMIHQTFHEIPLCIAIHPLSVQCAIGFKEGMKIFYVLDDELKHVYTSTTKLCTALNYSSKGKYLACGKIIYSRNLKKLFFEANKEIIVVYNPYDFQPLFQLSGHSAPINGIEWCDNDLKLISTCLGGVLNVWDINTNCRVVEHAYKTHKLNAVSYDSDYDLVICACSDQKLRMFKEKGQTQLAELDTLPSTFTSIWIESRLEVIFFGTSDGTVRIYLWPIWDFSSRESEFVEYNIHSSAITSLKVTNDLKYLISVAEDGSVYFCEILEFVEGEDLAKYQEKEKNSVQGKIKENLSKSVSKQQNKSSCNKRPNYDEDDNIFQMNQLCLCSKAIDQVKKESMKELEFRLQNCKSDIEDEKEKWEDYYTVKIKSLKEEHNGKKNHQKSALSNIYNNHELRFGQLKDSLKNLKGNTEDTSEGMCEKNARDLINCYQVQDRLNEELFNLKKKFGLSIEASSNNYASSIKKVSDEYEKKFDSMYHRFKLSSDKFENNEQNFSLVTQQQEEDFNVFFTATKESLKEELKDELTKTDEFRSSNSKFKKEIENYLERQVYLSQESDALDLEIQALEADSDGFKEKFKIMNKQLSEKEEIINFREQQVKDLRSTNAHLVNFKKVYDFQVNYIKDQRSPMKMQLTETDDKLRNIYKELIDEAGSGKKFGDDIKKQTEHVAELQQQLSKQKATVAQTARLIESFEYNILEMLRSPKLEKWPKRLVQIYKEFFSEQSALEKVVSQSIIGSNLKEQKKDALMEQMDQEQQFLIGSDLKNQRDFLARQLVKVAGDYKGVMESRNDAYLRIQNMNTLLINECNKMRDEKQKLKDYLSVQKKAYREVKRQLATLLGINFNLIQDDDAILFSEKSEDEAEEQQEEENKDNSKESAEFKGKYFLAAKKQHSPRIAHSSTNESSIKNNQLNITSGSNNSDPAVHFLSRKLSKIPLANKMSASQITFSSPNQITNFQSIQTSHRKSLGSDNIIDSHRTLQSIQKQGSVANNTVNNSLLHQQKQANSVFHASANKTAQLNTSSSVKLQPIAPADQSLIQDLLTQIGDTSDQSDDLSFQGDKLKQQVQFFLTQDKKDTVGSLPAIKKKFKTEA